MAPEARRVAIVAFAVSCLAVVSVAHAQPRVVADEDHDVMATLRASAQAGRPVAQFTLGSVLHYGGFDLEEASSWIRRAAEAGHAPAQFELGQMHEYGVGAEQSDVEALAWYRRAASTGLAAAERLVGDFYLDGRGGIEPDVREAAEWYRLAANGDDIRAQYVLGQMYFDGRHMPPDYVAAYQWFALAARQAPLPDNRKALIELRNIAAARMTPEAVSEAERRVAAWRPEARN